MDASGVGQVPDAVHSGLVYVIFDVVADQQVFVIGI